MLRTNHSALSGSFGARKIALAFLICGLTSFVTAEEKKVSSSIANGARIKFPKQPVLGGVGGNPWIWIRFLHADDEPASEEILIGRCVQSSK